MILILCVQKINFIHLGFQKILFSFGNPVSLCTLVFSKSGSSQPDLMDVWVYRIYTEKAEYSWVLFSLFCQSGWPWGTEEDERHFKKKKKKSSGHPTFFDLVSLDDHDFFFIASHSLQKETIINNYLWNRTWSRGVALHATFQNLLKTEFEFKPRLLPNTLTSNSLICLLASQPILEEHFKR